jgi:hypothetical protein
MIWNDLVYFQIKSPKCQIKSQKTSQIAISNQADLILPITANKLLQMSPTDLFYRSHINTQTGITDLQILPSLHKNTSLQQCITHVPAAFHPVNMASF